MFITAFKTARHLSLSWARSIQSILHIQILKDRYPIYTNKQISNYFQFHVWNSLEKRDPTFKNDGSDLTQMSVINTPAITTQKALNTKERVYYCC